MRAIQDFFEHRLNFQRYSAGSETFGHHLLEREFFRTKRFARGRTNLGIDFEDELFFALRPLLYRIISECKNHSHHNFGYIEMSFEIFIVLDRGLWTTLIEGYGENGQSLNEVDPDFVTVDRYGILLDKPFSLRLYVLNSDESLLPEYIHNPPIPPRIPFEQDTCVICLTNNPNILSSGCGHMCICDSCDKAHPINTCPLCRSGCVNKFYLRHY